MVQSIGFILAALILFVVPDVLAKRCTFQDEAKIINCSYSIVNEHYSHHLENHKNDTKTNQSFDIEIDNLTLVCQKYDQFLKCTSSVNDRCKERSLPNLIQLWQFLCADKFQQNITDEQKCFSEIRQNKDIQKCFEKNEIDVNDARFESQKLCIASQRRFQCFATFKQLEKCQNAVKLYQTFYQFLSHNFTSSKQKGNNDEKENENKCVYESMDEMIQRYKIIQAEKFIGGCVEVETTDDLGNSTLSEECSCIAGYKIDAKTKKCIDIDECSDVVHNCSQVCKNRQNGYDCECDNSFYTLLASDNQTCVRSQAGNDSVWLIFAHGQSIWNVSSDGKFVELKLTGLEKTAMLDLDLKEKSIYFVDSGKNLIEKSSLIHSTKPEIIQNYEVDGAEGIALDYIARNLYLARKTDIFVQTLDGKYRHRLFKNKLSTPRALVAHSEKGVIFGSDWSSSAFIYRASMDGQSFQKIITKNIVWPNGLAVDHYASRLFWADAFLDIIESTNFDGTHRRRIIENSGAVAHLFGLAVADNYIYWTDWNHRGILRADKITGKNVTLLAQTTLLPYGIKVYSTIAQPGLNVTENPCTKANCSQICLLSKNGTSAICSCADGYLLTADKQTCKVDCREPEQNVIVCGGSEPKCVSKRYVCDGILHCPDRIDEQNCPERVCPLGEFQCVDEPTKCLNATTVCDGQNQCKDGSDERYCTFKTR